MKVVIVEDEINNVELLNHFLLTYCHDIIISGNASKVNTAIELINTIKPDLILLDVELEDGTGFDVLDGISISESKVIFITGYEHYAIKAIKMSAIDYILKPFSIAELQEGIAKAKSIRLESNEIAQLQQKIKDLEPSFIWLSDTKKSLKVPVQSIEYIEADSAYSKVYLVSGASHYTSFSLNHFESILGSKTFFRTHKSYVLSLSKIMEIESGRGGHLIMKSGSKLPIAYRRKTKLKQALS